MTITGTKEIDFIFYKNETLHIETIKFEQQKMHKETLPYSRKFST